ncbi:MAG: RagB/SusD family nutrient uptake outer membrane protein [Chitinophagaceae bacterium]|nr:RagB/SusD family nutrient uptake outer membrane protein [Chitinophagaceae bacterium]
MKIHFVLNKFWVNSMMAALFILATGCNKQLRQGPIDAPYSQNFWTTQSSVEQAAIAMYGQLRACLRASNGYGVDYNEPKHFVWGDLTTGLFKVGAGETFVGKYFAAPTTNPAWTFSYHPYWEKLCDWSNFYQVIALSNLMLQNIPTMPASAFDSEATRNKYLAEAYFIRAYCYFYMTRVWGDPVYVSKSYNDVDYGKVPAVPRTPEAQVLDSCLQDLTVADGYMNYSGGDPNLTIRANKGSVEALKAHIFAWKHNYDSAHYYCQNVVSKGGYSLEPMSSYKNIWKGKTSKESIFELPMTFNAADFNFNSTNPNSDWIEAQFNTFGHFLKSPLLPNNLRTSCWNIPMDNVVFKTLFGDTTSQDLRLRNILSFQQAGNGDPAGYMLLKYTNFAYQNPDTRSHPYISNNMVLFRLADIILLDAESLASLGRIEDARAQLKLTETRAGITSYTNPPDIMDEIIAERGREMMGEGSWYYDLIRTNQKQQWLQFIGYPDDRVQPSNGGYYWPLDMTTLFPYDNLLTQNLWWTNH